MTTTDTDTPAPSFVRSDHHSREVRVTGVWDGEEELRFDHLRQIVAAVERAADGEDMGDASVVIDNPEEFSLRITVRFTSSTSEGRQL